MRTFKLPWRAIAQVISTAGFWVCGTALAQVFTPVNGYIVINPISVCVNGLCAAFGEQCTTITSGSTAGNPSCTLFSTPSTATSTTPIGFVDGDKHVNLTRAFWAQAGIDVAFLPVQSYTSPTNTNPWPGASDALTGKSWGIAPAIYSTSGNYKTLHQINVTCADGTNVLTSPDLQALTQHTLCTDHQDLNGNLLSNTYKSLSNPPPKPSPAPPLAINGCGAPPLNCNVLSNALDVFFIDTINGYPASSTSTTLYGFGWINYDGLAIAGKNAMKTLAPRVDTLAHEAGHNMSLDHNTYGAGDTIYDNLMTSGTTRSTSKSSGCFIGTTTDTTPPTIYQNGALYDLDFSTTTFNPCNNSYMMLTDQMITGGSCSDPKNRTTCTTQQAAAAISPFINQTLSSAASATGATGASVANAATTSTPSSSGSGTPAPVSITISASGNPNDQLASIILALPPSSPISFSGNTPVSQIGGTGCMVDPSSGKLINCEVTVTSVVKLSNQMVTGNPGCDSGTGQPPSSQCINVTFSPGFVPGIDVILAVDFNKDAGTIISQNLLAGSQYTVIIATSGSTAETLATTTTFGDNINGVVTADSRFPDLTTANVILDPTKIVNASAADPNIGPELARCTPPYNTVFVKIKGKLVPQMVCPGGSISAGPD